MPPSQSKQSRMEEKVRSLAGIRFVGGIQADQATLAKRIGRPGLLTSTALCLGMALATQAVAQPRLEEIVVTAQKREQSVNDVGITVNAFSAERLDNFGVRSAADLEVLTPGLTITEAAPTGVPVYTIRGVGFSDFSTASSSTVGLYFDEAAMPYAVMSRGVLFDIERVEVLKGPQGDLYGRNTTAGQINFVSRKPSDEFEAGSTIEFSRFNVLDVEGYISGPIQDGIRARLAAKVVQSSKGWQQSISRPGDTLGERDEIALRGILTMDISEDATLLLNLRWIRDKSDNMAPTAYDGTIVGFPAPQPLPTAQDATPFFSTGKNRAADWAADFRPERDNTLKGITAKLDWDFDGINLTSISAYDKFDRDERYETSGVPFEDGQTINGTDLKAFSQEIRLSSNNESDFYWIVGGYYSWDKLAENYEFFFDQSFFGFVLGINEIDTDYRQTTESAAAFAHVEWRFAEQFRLTLGARYTEEDRKWSGCTYDSGDGSLAWAWNNILTPFLIVPGGFPDPGIMPPGGCGIYNDLPGTPNFGQLTEFSDAIDTNKVMWKVTLDYAPSDDILLYGTVSRGFKSGGFNGASAQTHSQLLPYRAETLTSFEAGLKSTLLDSRLQLNAAAFYYDYKDKQEPSIAVTPVGNIAGLTNVPKSEIMGAELEMRWLVTQGLVWDVGVAYLHTKIKEYLAVDGAASVFPNVVTFDASGFELANSPDWQATSTLTYTWNLTDDLEMMAAGDISYKDDSDGSTQDPISDYVLVNLRLGIGGADQRWKATVWGRNIFNRYYWSAAYLSNGTFVRMNGMPATYGVSLSYNF